ncbi:MAG: hypothetical protein RLY82_1021 [Pseudomonadota bacterium]|jgi:hypothetical protein
MNLFRRPDYQSETTQFIEQLKVTKPTLEAEQLAGRALLWDKSINRSSASDMAAGRVTQKSYVYGSK